MVSAFPNIEVGRLMFDKEEDGEIGGIAIFCMSWKPCFTWALAGSQKVGMFIIDVC